MGAHRKITELVAAELCARMSEGRSLRSVCADSDMPDAATVFRHLARDTDFREQYTRAREASADAIFEQMLHIADTPQMGTRIKTRADGTEEIITGDMIDHRRLQVDSRKWFLSKILPKKYGEKMQVETERKGDFTLAELLATMRRNGE